VPLVPESETAIVGMVAGTAASYLQEIVGGPSQLRIVNAVSGRLRGQVPIPPIASIGGLVRTTGNQVLIQTQTFTEPGRWWRLDPMRDDLIRPR